MNRYRIAMVFDTMYGEKVRKLAKKMYVWIIYSPVNNRFAHLIWDDLSASDEFNQNQGITIMGDKNTQPAFDTDLLDDIWIHHSDQWHNPPISEIFVIGVDLQPSIRSMLDDYGLDIIEENEDYFIARDRYASLYSISVMR